MSRFERWLLHVATLLVAGTGLVYAWMIYFARPADPYAVVNHPWQPATQHLHVLVAPLLVFGAGVIWRRHVWAQWQRRVPQGLASGVALGLTLIPMIVSGYLLQTATGDTWRKVWVWVHIATSVLWLAGYLAHQAVRLRRRSLRRAPSTSSPPFPTGTRSPGARRFPTPTARGRTDAG
ncbi:MAG TPA: hypothetical protein DD490_15360 [Acidobacteria bacterium]|nr:hypothetical protein [Acidobacteriota bacterium]